MARYSEDFFLNLEHFCCFLFAEFIDLKSHHKFLERKFSISLLLMACFQIWPAIKQRLVPGRSCWWFIDTIYLYTVHFWTTSDLERELPTGLWLGGGNLPTDQATNRIGVFRPWKVNSTWIIDEIDSDTAVRASAQVELSQSLMGLLKASESFVF